MSLILEALKKAERQHKLGEVPRISAYLGESHDQGSGRKVWILLILFAFIMLGIGIFLGEMRSKPQEQKQTEAPTPAKETQPEEVLTVDESPHAGELSVRPSHAKIEDSEPMPQPDTSEVQNRASSVSPETISQSLQPVSPGSVLTSTSPNSEIQPPRADPPEPAAPVAKPLNEMSSGFVSNLPDMNIDIHSYDTLPKNRYILVNMEKYQEGDYLAEGPQVIEILPEGVVMEHMGARFIMPMGN
jgi:general secretion pathway protein B